MVHDGVHSKLRYVKAKPVLSLYCKAIWQTQQCIALTLEFFILPEGGCTLPCMLSLRNILLQSSVSEFLWQSEEANLHFSCHKLYLNIQYVCSPAVLIK